MPRFLRLAPAMICIGSLAMLAGCAVKAVPGPPSVTADLADLAAWLLKYAGQ